MPKIRHEINLLNGTLVGAVTANERIRFDQSQYSGTLTIFLEALASISTGSGNVSLTNGTTNWTLGFSSATVTLSRTQVTTLPASVFLELWITSVANMTVKAARLVVIQDTGGFPLTASQTQIEIGSRSSVTAITIPTGASASNQTNPKYWQYDSSKLDGDVSLLFEAVLASAASKTASTVQLQVADGTGDGFTGWSNVTNGSVTSLSLTAERVRAVSSFTPVNGRWYRIVSASPASKTAMNVYSAKIIIQQSYTAQDTYTGTSDSIIQIYGLGSSGSDMVGQSFTAGSSYDLGAIGILIAKVGAPTDDLLMELVATSITGTVLGSVTKATSALASNTYNLFSFSPMVALTSGVQYFIRVSRAGSLDQTNYWQWQGQSTGAYSGGGAWRYSSGAWNSAGSNDRFFTAYSATVVTKLQEQHLLSNTLLAAGTALQKFMTNWDSTEWSGVANTYALQAEAANGSTSALQLRTADDATLVATVTSPDNAGTGTATMPASANLDVKATTNNGDLYAARLVVSVTVLSAVREQFIFRARNNDGSETSATWIATAGTDWSQLADSSFRVRFLVKNTAAFGGFAGQLQYNKNGIGWNNVTNASSVVKVVSPVKDSYDELNARQSFGDAWQSVTPPVSFSLRAIGLKWHQVSATGSVTLGIKAMSGGSPSGGFLASVVINAATIRAAPDDFTFVYYLLDSSANLSSGTQYAISLVFVGSNFVYISINSPGNYSGGGYFGGASDMIFQLLDGYWLSDGTATTQQIGSGSFVAGFIDTVDGLCSSVTLSAGQETELEYVLTIVSADVANADTIQLRIAGMDTYTDTPVITVGSTAPAAPIGRITQARQAIHRASYY